MGENFIKFKKRAFKIRLFKSLFLGIALGTLTAGALMLLEKLGIIAIGALISALIGLGAAAVFSSGAFFLLATSDTDLARLLDRELSLDERVETMLQYANEDSPIHKLQREDTNARLAEVSPKVIRPKRMWIYILLLLYVLFYKQYNI